MQSDHGIGRRAMRVALCAGKRACRLLHSSEAAQVNYWPIFLFREQELAWGSSPVDLYRPRVKKQNKTHVTLYQRREKRNKV